MSQDKRNPSDGIPEDSKSSRRDLLKRTLIGLGASVIVQPNGGVVFGQEPKKKKKVENKNEGAKKEKQQKPNGTTSAGPAAGSPLVRKKTNKRQDENKAIEAQKQK
jgi:hypothetical protein